MSTSTHLTYKKSIADYLKVDDTKIFLFWKGRVALYAILKGLGITAGDEVIIPAFTCVVVPNAIIYLGAKPIYVDIDPATYNMDITKLATAITSKTKVIIAQNTFGLSPDINAIEALVGKSEISIIEDCTHGMGGYYKGKSNGTILKASFFSTQWNKPYSTGIGGMAYINDEALAKKISMYEQEAIQPSLKDNVSLRTLIWVRTNLITPATYWTAINMYRWLSHRKIVTGSSQGEELEKPIMPFGFFKGMSKTQARVGIKAILKMDMAIAHQRKVAAAYHKFFASHQISMPIVHQDYFHTYLKYPILVRDRAQFMERANQEKIELGEWFNSPIHPIIKDFDAWQYTWGNHPVAETISSQIVNLPTGININEVYLTRILTFLASEIRNILDGQAG
jgi:dTDP-4-amino-4,6-dideoxygalactose transaminase